MTPPLTSSSVCRELSPPPGLPLRKPPWTHPQALPCSVGLAVSPQQPSHTHTHACTHTHIVGLNPLTMAWGSFLRKLFSDCDTTAPHVPPTL